jgi:NADH-quinone oxidoreductase subunit N
VSATDLVALLPLVVLAAAAVAAMLAIAVRRSHVLSAVLTLVGLLAAGGTLFIAAAVAPRQVTALLLVDRYALFFIGLVIAASFAVALLSYGYLEKCAGHHEEYYVLLLLATLGAAVLVTSSHLASLFLGLEILSVGLYALIAYVRIDERGVEAGIKYLVLAAVSVSFLLFGMALVYADQGTMALDLLAARLASDAAPSALLLTGLAMIVVGVGFKLALVPFHMWTADVYQGAPAPVTAFVATVSKGAVFAALLRYVDQGGLGSPGTLSIALSVVAVVSMLVGNLLALLQENLKRVLAYSSIAHMGYLLVALLAGGSMAVSVAGFYLVAYFVTTLGAFGVVTALAKPGEEEEDVAAYRSLFWRRPWLAATLTATLLSLAGIPLTAGFIGKFYLLAAGVGAARWGLVVVLVVGSAIGLYYYLRIIVAMVQPLPKEAGHGARLVLPLTSSALLALLVLLLLALGLYPTPLLDVIQAIALH